MNAGAEGNVTGGPAVDVEALGFVPAARITVSRGEKQQYLRVLRYFDSTDVDRAGGGAEERLDRRLPAQHLVKGRPYQRGLLAQRLPLRRVGGEGVERVANADNCGVESGREQRAHQQRGLLRRDLAGVDRGPDDGTETGGRQRLAGALGIDPGHDLCRLGHDSL